MTPYTTAGEKAVKTGPAVWHGLNVVYDGTNTVTVAVYDGSVATGTKLYQRAFTASDDVLVAGDGIMIKTTLTVNITQAAGTIFVSVVHGGIGRAS